MVSAPLQASHRMRGCWCLHLLLAHLPIKQHECSTSGGSDLVWPWVVFHHAARLQGSRRTPFPVSHLLIPSSRDCLSFHSVTIKDVLGWRYYAGH